jgi:hypothetical protein
LFKAGTDVNYTDTDGKTQNAIALAADSDTLRIFFPIWESTKEGKLKVKTSAGDKELEFTWAEFGSRAYSIIDVAAVLCVPEHADQELSNARELNRKVAVAKRGTRPSATVTVAGAEGSKANALNGLYYPTGDLYNGKPLFRKQNDLGGDGEWLRFATDDRWIFSDTRSKVANNTSGCACSLHSGFDHPTSVVKWYPPMKCTSSHSASFAEKAQRAEKAGALALVVINRYKFLKVESPSVVQCSSHNLILRISER